MQVGHTVVQFVKARTTGRKLVGSIPDDSATESFHWHNPSGRTMTLGLT
jgi:hypothetical protein